MMSVMKAKECATKRRLSEELERATSAVVALKKGETPKPGISLETALKHLNRARQAYFAHLREHSC